MIFNFWRPYPLFKPKKEGWYQCTVIDLSKPSKKRVMDLYFGWDRKWNDFRRQRVFDGYKVYKSCREPSEFNRVRNDSLCIRDDVVAWKKLPKPSIFGRKKLKEIKG